MEEKQFIEDGIYYRHWPSNSETKAVVLLVHGAGEHCERYSALAESLNNSGYALCSLDLPGHGRSEGTRTHIGNFVDFENAVLNAYGKAQEWYPEKSIFLLGHSMGGLIAAHLLLEHQHLFKGALLSGPAIQSPVVPPAWQIGIIKVIAKISPKFGAIALDASGICRDQAVVDDYMNDPLVSKGKLSAKLLIEMFRAMDECIDRAADINLPIRIMHGSSDALTAPAGSQLLHDSVSSADKEIEIYDGLYHEIFNEPEAPQIYQQVVAWLDKRV